MEELAFLRLHRLDSKGYSSSFSLSCPPFLRLQLHIWLPNDPPLHTPSRRKGKACGREERLGIGRAEGLLAFFPRL